MPTFTGASRLDKETVLARARELGADLVGITDIAPFKEQDARFKSWLAAGKHAGMKWLEQRTAQRLLFESPFPAARSIIVIALNYNTGQSSAQDTGPPVYNVSRYAQGRDYHKVVRRLLKGLAGYISEQTGCQSRGFVDSGPVMEKAIAQRAGLGWIGKNNLLLNRTFGSWLVLGELFTELELTPDHPHPDYCGECTLCLRACPTGALTDNGLDCKNCISYATIERPEAEPSQLKPGGSIFGCDICQEACPWNAETMVTGLEDFKKRELIEELSRGKLPPDAEAWELANRGSSLRRMSYHRLLENAASVDRERAER
jgi:epoxyqueuosine reductase